jgi:hypothetical protein
MELRQNLIELYRELAGTGCTFKPGPNGPAFNPECPAVRAHACSAVAEALQLYLRLGQRDAAVRLKASAIEGSNCPAAPLDAILH